MSDDAELIKRAFELLQSDTYEQVLPLISDDFEMVTTAEVASEPDVYRGPEGVRRWWVSFLEAMEWVRLEPKAFEEVGDGRLIVDFIIHTKGKASGIETGLRATAIATASDGELLRLELFTDLELARAAARPQPG